MENMLHIGAKVDKESSENLTESLLKVLDKVYETRQSDEVTLKTLSILQNTFEVKNVNIQQCTFDNVKTRVEVTVEDEDATVLTNK